MRLIDADAFIVKMNDRIKDAINWLINAIIEEDPNEDEVKVRAVQAGATFREALLTAEKMPTIDVVPVKRGIWLKTGQSFVSPNKFLNYFCSECGYELDKSIRTEYNYCPNCGVKMTRDKLGQKGS